MDTEKQKLIGDIGRILAGRDTAFVRRVAHAVRCGRAYPAESPTGNAKLILAALDRLCGRVCGPVEPVGQRSRRRILTAADILAGNAPVCRET